MNLSSIKVCALLGWNYYIYTQIRLATHKAKKVFLKKCVKRKKESYNSLENIKPILQYCLAKFNAEEIESYLNDLDIDKKKNIEDRLELNELKLVNEILINNEKYAKNKKLKNKFKDIYVKSVIAIRKTRGNVLKERDIIVGVCAG